MTVQDLKRRLVQGVDTSPMDTPIVPLTTNSQTVKLQQVSKWQQDNKFILTGYRPENTNYLDILMSLTFLHNETVNVYTHMIGALLLPFIAIASLRVLSAPEFLNVSVTDYIMFQIFFWSAETCLVFSSLYHLLGPHSHGVEQFWHGMDLLGIVTVTVGTFIPGIYYIFYCEPRLQKLHWAIITASGSATAAFISIPRFRTLRWCNVRVGAYIALGTSAFIPLLHGAQLYGLHYMLQYSGMKVYLLELVLYGGGVALYGCRAPERFRPGKFDIWGSSHQMFHVCILCAMYVNVISLVQSFTLCHTLDICSIQATHQAAKT